MRHLYEKKNLWAKLKNEGEKLSNILKREINDKLPPMNVQDLDPDLLEELRSMGYVQ